MDSVTAANGAQDTSDAQLWRCIAALDGSHITSALLCCMYIGHNSSVCCCSVFSVFDQRNKSGEVKQVFLLPGSERRMQTPRDDQLQIVLLHLVRLVSTHSGFERQQVLVLYSPRLREHLPPAILAGSFRAKHREQ